MRRGRLFYVAPADPDPLPGALGAAARNKVLGVATAIRAAGGRPFVVTTLPGMGRVRHRAGTGFVRLPATGRRLVRRATAALALARFAFVVRRDDRVLLYNYFPEYLPLAAILRWRRRPAILDIEDAPLTRDRSLLQRINHWCYRLLAPLTASHRMVASRVLAGPLGIARALPVYGIATPRAPVRRFAGAGITVHFGGSLLPETGIDLFAAAVRRVAAIRPATRLRFHVTGLVPPGRLEGLPGVTVHASLGDAAYRALLAGMDVGLSLKRGTTEMGRTTFPSKTIEIAEQGLLLVSTRVSDVPALFDDGCAILLPDETPEALAAALLAIEDDPAAAAARAAAGQARVVARLAPARVGADLLDFLA